MMKAKGNLKGLKRALIFSSLSLSALSLTACAGNPFGIVGAPSDSSVKTSTKNYASTNAKDIQIFEAGKPKRDYEAIGKVSVDETTFFVSRSLESKYSIMKEKAAAMGGNAIIDIKETMAAMTGVVVRYT